MISKVNKMIDLLFSMEVDDSFEIKTSYDYASYRKAIEYVNKNSQWRYTIRSLDNGRRRIWRVK